MIPQGSHSCSVNLDLSTSPELHLKKKRKEMATSTPRGRALTLRTEIAAFPTPDSGPGGWLDRARGAGSWEGKDGGTWVGPARS